MYSAFWGKRSKQKQKRKSINGDRRQIKGKRKASPFEDQATLSLLLFITAVIKQRYKEQREEEEEDRFPWSRMTHIFLPGLRFLLLASIVCVYVE